jgi:zinc transporter ZupT
MTFERLPYRFLQWLVFLCVALHNLEEGLAAKAYFPKVKDLLRNRVPAAVLASIPSLEQFYIALVGATLVPFVLTVIATTGRPTRFKSYLVAVVAMGLLLNVFIPHVPAAVALGGYAPGVATAVLINLPFSIYFLRRSLREGRVDGRGLVVTAAIALTILLLGVPLLWLLTGN